ncbi:MAG TPA: twin-arginine translocation signal domain-containing protein, partial [Ktedonobacterales bacterium]|nr:twin-arginine translocation signal domain-containing protein [Ktedonobacterales bacterium]
MAKRRGRGVAPGDDTQRPMESQSTQETRRWQRVLTRREFVVTAAATVAVAGCAPFASSSGAVSGKAPATSAFTRTAPVIVTPDATVPADLADAVASTLGGHGGVS